MSRTLCGAREGRRPPAQRGRESATHEAAATAINARISTPRLIRPFWFGLQPGATADWLKMTHGLLDRGRPADPGRAQARGDSDRPGRAERGVPARRRATRGAAGIPRWGGQDLGADD